MAVQPQFDDCVRMREFVSMRLDGELSALEERRLEAHLDRCAECAAFADGVGRTAALLRAAAPETTELSFALPSRRWRVMQPAQVAVAAAAAVVVGAFGLPHLIGAGGQQGASSLGFVAAPKTPAYLQSPEYEIKMLEHATRVRPHVRLSR